MWQVYLARCSDGSLYCGVAKDAVARCGEHNESPRGAKYTRPRRPVTLAYVEDARDRSSACRREAEIKRMGKEGKEALVAGKIKIYQEIFIEEDGTWRVGKVKAEINGKRVPVAVARRAYKREMERIDPGV
jgi:putative endonuclease